MHNIVLDKIETMSLSTIFTSTKIYGDILLVKFRESKNRGKRRALFYEDMLPLLDELLTNAYVKISTRRKFNIHHNSWMSFDSIDLPYLIEYIRRTRDIRMIEEACMAYGGGDDVVVTIEDYIVMTGKDSIRIKNKRTVLIEYKKELSIKPYNFFFDKSILNYMRL